MHLLLKHVTDEARSLSKAIWMNFFEDNRGGKHGLTFFDIYPELENMAKLYALES